MTGLALRVSVPKWNVESELGYKPITTFWEDFSIADKFGNGIRRTFFLPNSTTSCMIWLLSMPRTT